MTNIAQVLENPKVFSRKVNTMSKRRRKRLFKGEYASIGFELVIEHLVTNQEANEFVDWFIEMLEILGCFMCGWVKTIDQPNGYCLIDCGSPIQAKRRAVSILTWLHREQFEGKYGIKVYFSNLHDINYDTDKPIAEKRYCFKEPEIVYDLVKQANADLASEEPTYEMQELEVEKEMTRLKTRLLGVTWAPDANELTREQRKKSLIGSLYGVLQGNFTVVTDREMMD